MFQRIYPIYGIHVCKDGELMYLCTNVYIAYKMFHILCYKITLFLFKREMVIGLI